jgi:hypothetical protein
VEKNSEKNQGMGEWKAELDVRMDFLVCGVATVLHILFGVHLCITNLFLL